VFFSNVSKISVNTVLRYDVRSVTCLVQQSDRTIVWYVRLFLLFLLQTQPCSFSLTEPSYGM
jgi:hypothetical protein